MRRRLALETIGLEAFTSLDGQGSPSYGASVASKAHVLHKDDLAIQADGSEVRSTITLYVGTDVTVPGHRDRVTPADGIAYIMLESKPVKRFNGTIDHTRLKGREE